MRIILVHGYKSSSQGQFLPWLKDELRRKGHEVVALDFPNPEAPELEEWFKLLSEEVCPLTEDDILIGHSLGGAMLLRFLDNAEARTLPKGVITVAAPWFINHEQLRSFFPMDFDYEVIMWKAKLFTVIHSKDDKIVPFDHAEKYQKMLHATLLETHGDGHFQGEQYPIILEEKKKIIDAQIECAPGESLNDQFSGLH
jgi:hypothetical protein